MNKWLRSPIVVPFASVGFLWLLFEVLKVVVEEFWFIALAFVLLFIISL